MTDREGLYAAVLADPDADAPRLVFADWLEEHAQCEADTARARFIRMEIHAENLPVGEPERIEIESEAARLFNRYGETWSLQLPTWKEWYDSTLVYRRGFPYELRTNFRKLFLSGGKLFSEAPLQSLVVQNYRGRESWNPGLLQAVGGVLPGLDQIRELWIGPHVSLGGSSERVRNMFQVVVRYPSLSRLQRLSFARCQINDESIRLLERAMQEAVFLQSLEELDLSDNEIQGNGATILCTFATLIGIRRLILSGNPLTPLGVRMLKNHFGERVIL